MKLIIVMFRGKLSTLEVHRCLFEFRKCGSQFAQHGFKNNNNNQIITCFSDDLDKDYGEDIQKNVQFFYDQPVEHLFT